MTVWRSIFFAFLQTFHVRNLAKIRSKINSSFFIINLIIKKEIGSKKIKYFEIAKKQTAKKPFTSINGIIGIPKKV